MKTYALPIPVREEEPGWKWPVVCVTAARRLDWPDLGLQTTSFNKSLWGTDLDIRVRWGRGIVRVTSAQGQSLSCTPPTQFQDE